MDNNGRFLAGSGAHLRMVSEMNCGPSEHVTQPCFLNLGYWDQSMDQSSLFGSGLTSIVSSPSTAPAPALAPESVMLGELIGRLGSICKSGEISPQSHSLSHSPTNSCYATPLNSPKNLNLPPISGNLVIPPPPPALTTTHLSSFTSDPAFTERLTRFSSFGNGGSLMGSSEVSTPAAGSQLGIETIPHISLIRSRSPTIPDAQIGVSRDESSSASDHPIGGTCSGGGGGGGGSNPRKRKAVQKGRRTNDLPLSSMTKMISETMNSNSNSKRVKCSEAMERSTKNELSKPKVEPSSSTYNNTGDGDQKGEKEDKPKQDYIHVRARRGQATDSHSLAERVRREKISERMNFLQDLVPGCNKVTGKAVRLDEIINYVQSLQRQVEFLSMKLATVNPWTEFNMENLACKDIYEAHHRSLAFPSEIPATVTPVFPFVPHTQIQSSTLRKSGGMMQLPTFDGFPSFTSQSQQDSPYFYDNDLQNMVQMGGIGPTSQLN